MKCLLVSGVHSQCAVTRGPEDVAVTTGDMAKVTQSNIFSCVRNTFEFFIILVYLDEFNKIVCTKIQIFDQGLNPDCLLSYESLLPLH